MRVCLPLTHVHVHTYQGAVPHQKACHTACTYTPMDQTAAILRAASTQGMYMTRWVQHCTACRPDISSPHTSMYRRCPSIQVYSLSVHALVNSKHDDAVQFVRAVCATASETSSSHHASARAAMRRSSSSSSSGLSKQNDKPLSKKRVMWHEQDMHVNVTHTPARTRTPPPRPLINPIMPVRARRL